MPKYRGIRVLQYECDRLEALDALDRDEIILLEKMKDMYSDDIHACLISSHESSIKDRSEKLTTYKSKLAEFLQSDTPEETTISYEPLEFLYQEFLQDSLPFLLKRIEIAYENHYDSVLSSGAVLFANTAKKVAVHNLHHHAVGSIVREYLLKKQIQELQSLPRSLNNPILAIQDKYEYYEDRLEHCIEIGNKIRELQGK